jgi:hypothetical protein
VKYAETIQIKEEDWRIVYSGRVTYLVYVEVNFEED